MPNNPDLNQALPHDGMEITPGNAQTPDAIRSVDIMDKYDREKLESLLRSTNTLSQRIQSIITMLESLNNTPEDSPLRDLKPELMEFVTTNIPKHQNNIRAMTYELEELSRLIQDTKRS